MTAKQHLKTSAKQHSSSHCFPFQNCHTFLYACILLNVSEACFEVTHKSYSLFLHFKFYLFSIVKQQGRIVLPQHLFLCCQGRATCSVVTAQDGQSSSVFGEKVVACIPQNTTSGSWSDQVAPLQAGVLKSSLKRAP